MSGFVSFVGAGPGRGDWITVAGRDAVRAAEVVITDALVSPVILAEASWDAVVRDVGKRGGRTSVPQEEICDAILAEARAGRRVVRLKGGDPGTFGRLAEELAVVRAAGIPYAIVPGVTAASAAAARAGMPLTDRDLSASVTLLTGHRRAAGPQPELDWEAAARSGTVVAYMGIQQAAESAERLLAAGVDPATPVAIVRWAATRREGVWQTVLGDLPAAIERWGIRPPAVWMLGSVAAGAGADPLNAPAVYGTVGLFRPLGGGADDWRPALRAAGWEAMACPLQRIVPPADGWVSLRDAAEPRPDWLALTSPAAVACWLDGEAALGRDVRTWAGVRLAAVGPATAAALAARGLRADWTGDDARGADALIEHLCTQPAGRVALLQAADARPGPREHLAAAGWTVAAAATHRKEARPEPPAALGFALRRRWLDVALWTSASQLELAVQEPAAWDGVRHVALGTHTAAAVVAAGLPEPTVAPSPSLDGVLAALAVVAT